MRHLYSIFTCSVLFAVNGLAPTYGADDKGVQKCPDNQVCFTVNPAALASNTVDISLNYRYSGPQGTGKSEVLDNGATLKSGDKFTMDLEARESRYVYLFHFDSNGQLNELLSLSGKRNKVEAGSKLTLPAPDQHFLLDNKTGVETIHTIVSKTELTGLWEKYRAMLSAPKERVPTLTVALNEIIHNQNKGLCVRNNNGQAMNCPDDQPVAKSDPPAPQSTPPFQAQGGRTVICQGGDSCRDSFTIRHVGR